MGDSSTDVAVGASDANTLVRLIEQIAQANDGALKELFDRTSPKLFGICLRILHDRQDAEDALQEVFVSVWRRAASFDRARSSPITWLAAIARNRAVDRLRSAERHRGGSPVEDAVDLADTAADSFELTAVAQEESRLRTCLEKLEERQCGAIREAFFGGFVYSELAERAGVPLGTMKSWIRRGLQNLRKCLEG